MQQRKLKILEKGAGLAIAAAFGCTPQTVCNALKGKTHSVLIYKIRRYAIENYTCVYYAGSSFDKKRYEVVRLCQGCHNHAETQEGDYCMLGCQYIRSQKYRCKYRTTGKEAAI